MTKLEAVLIRTMREDLEFTWRKIAEVWAESHNETDTTQERGRELCEQAKVILEKEVD